MSTRRRVSTKSEIRRSLHAMKWTQGKNRVLCVLGVFVTLGVAFALMQSVMAAKGKVRVLDCPVTEAVAHHHNEDCYADGELVCPLPERGLHIHDESCYERQLACGLEEGEGHKHTKDCYDSDGNVICGFEESEAHKHTDDCYADVLVCDKEEVVNEHVHGDGCFHVVATDDDAEQTIMPERAFFDDVLDADGKSVMSVAVSSPEGALPEGTTMELSLVDPATLDRDVLQAAVDDKAAKSESLEPGRILDLQAVDITFRDTEGISIEPKSDVIVTLTSPLIEKNDGSVIMHLSDQASDDAARTAEVVDHLGDKQLARHKMSLDEDQMAFESSSFSTYVVASTSRHQELSSSDGQSSTFTVDVPAEAGIPASAHLKVSEIARADEEYADYVDRSTEATKLDKDAIGLARFFDICIEGEDGEEIQPLVPVDVKMELANIPTEPTDFKLVHFAEDESGKQAEAPEELAAGGENGTTTFTAESFSVYGVIYTVDFGYEIDGQSYDFSIKGGDTISLAEVVDTLNVSDNDSKKYNTPEKFLAGVENVEFSAPEYILVKKVDGKSTVRQLLDKYELVPEYSADWTEAEFNEAMAKEYENEWVLFSLKPFDTNEILTITMDDGSQVVVKITDAHDYAQDPDDPHKLVVATIPNPGATTIDLFDYWASDTDSNPSGFDYNNLRKQWPGFQSGWNFDMYDNSGNSNNGGQVRGHGNWEGINKNHSLKFTPATDNTVLYGDGQRNSDDRGKNIGNRLAHDYSGNADPTPGIIQNQLVGGYPKLSNSKGVSDESLAYLFDPTEFQGKKAYMGVNNLLYLDENGYYTYDSREVQAQFDTNKKTFKVTDQNPGYSTEQKGFWPFGLYNWWLGMHVNTQFMQPDGGQIADSHNQMRDMEFNFSGDDDAWVFIDGVLIGDGGGIHNRTEIDINFRTGDVRVVALDSSHGGSYSHTTNLRAIFEQAKGADYVNARFDQGSNTFKSGTPHTFDFFYLERGGGESNLYLHYNLQSTSDFRARKEYYPEDKNEHLQQDQFQFELIGIDGRIKDGQIDPNHANESAIMPPASANGLGTALSPSLTHTSFDYDDPTAGNVRLNASIYKTGNYADGSIAFGTAIIPESIKADYDADPSNPPTYRYLVMEAVPDDAYNVHGVQWKSATTAEKLAGGFYKDGIVYDSTRLFLQVSVTKQQVTDPVTGDPMTDSQGNPVYEYALTGDLYTDVFFTNKIENPAGYELVFRNVAMTPVDLNITKVDSKNNTTPLQGAKFQAGFAIFNEQSQKWELTGQLGTEVVTDADGKASFPGQAPGFYLLRETGAPSGYKLSDKMWVIENRQVEVQDASWPGGKYYRIVPFVMEINADGTVPTGATFVEQTSIEHGLEVNIPNDELDKFRLIVEKQWDSIDAADAAIADSSIEVTLGRYTLTDRVGTIKIVKQGVPDGASTIAVYVINKVLPDGTEERAAVTYNNTWDGSDIEIGTFTLDADTAGTTYKVYETIFFEDPGYDAQHNVGIDNPQTITLQEGDSETATFTSNYTERRGHLYMKTVLNDNRTGSPAPVDTSNVKYELYNANGTIVATYTYAEVMNNYDPDNGFDMGEWTVGTYALSETGWPDLPDADEEHYPEQTATGASVSLRTLSAGGSQTFDFETTYKDEHVTTVSVYTYVKGDPQTITWTGQDFDIKGTHGKITFTGIPGDSDYTDANRQKLDDNVIAGNNYMSTAYNIEWDPYTDGTQPTAGSFVFEIPYGVDTYGVLIGTDSDRSTIASINGVEYVQTQAGGNGGNSTNNTNSASGNRNARALFAASDASGGDTAESTTEQHLTPAEVRDMIDDATDGQQDASDANDEPVKILGAEDIDLSKDGAPKLLAAGPLRGKAFTPVQSGIKPGHDILSIFWNSQTIPGPESTTAKKYVPDTPFNDQANKVTLTQADDYENSTTWKKVVEDTYPAFDDNGNKYYYYIASVTERELPKGTEGWLVTTGDGHQLVSSFIDNSTDPTALAVKNHVGTPADVTLIKVDQTDTTKQLAGAKFHLLQMGDTDYELVKQPDLEEVTPGETVTLDTTTGIFTVPAGGVTMKALQPGQYKLVEDECPPGYIMSTTEFEFEVENDGTLVSSYNAQGTLIMRIPNPPGSELPHAGGIGTTLFLVLGCAMATAGALVLLRNRREA